MCLVLLHLLEFPLGHRKANVNRVDLVDDDERRSRPRLHKVPLLHQQAARLARNRRPDGRVVEVELDVGQRGAVGFNHLLLRDGVRGRLVGLRLGDEILEHERRIPLRVAARVLGLRLIARQHGARLVERGLERPWVDLEQELAGADLITFPESHAIEHATHLRLHGHRLHGLDEAVRHHHVRRRAKLGRRNRHGHWRASRGSRLGASRCNNRHREGKNDRTVQEHLWAPGGLGGE